MKAFSSVSRRFIGRDLYTNGGVRAAALTIRLVSAANLALRPGKLALIIE